MIDRWRYWIIGFISGMILPPMGAFIYLKFIMGLGVFKVSVVGLDLIDVYPNAIQLGLLLNLIPFWLAQYILKKDNMLRGVIASTVFWGLLLLINVLFS